MIIGFTGHRDKITHGLRLAGIQLDYPDAKWIHGGAKTGFDKQVQEHIKLNDIPFQVYPPEYDRYSPKVAPIMRNYVIVDTCDLLVACFDGRVFGGTARTVAYAEKMGKEVFYVIALPVKSKTVKVI